ncbi:uncharacterized protein LAESUDRAFT_287767 [Laetiporus sulphureus 93-53]|uniref:Uncharacterized protein n=1 Tax=Laetiporus sulphureus 93-53 TaxID=1314785 RepID=A0A165DCY8_9APHY|nr:uncharacterized protein LAESUDRAFT_287767 [Laetiporus sulphureus 93-53]KZT04594.1 hypothetical protein LAESUDRAFT_287767 [Laetiporus sulphureus 93-53]
MTSRVFEMLGTGCCGAGGYRDISKHPKITRRTVMIDREKLDSMEGLLSKTVKTWKALDMRYAHLLGALAAACSVVTPKFAMFTSRLQDYRA